MTDTSSIVLSVPGMSCAHCESAVRREVSAVRGVVAVDVDLDSKDVTVTGSNLDRDLLVAAIDEAGYDVS